MYIVEYYCKVDSEINWTSIHNIELNFVNVYTINNTHTTQMMYLLPHSTEHNTVSHQHGDEYDVERYVPPGEDNINYTTLTTHVNLQNKSKYFSSLMPWANWVKVFLFNPATIPHLTAFTWTLHILTTTLLMGQMNHWQMVCMQWLKVVGTISTSTGCNINSTVQKR